MDNPTLRKTITDGITTILSKRLARAFMSQQQLQILEAQQTYWQNNDQAIADLQKLLPPTL